MFANRLPNRLTFVLVLVILLAALVMPAVSAQEASPTEEGIALYDAGDFEGEFTVTLERVEE